MLAFEYSTPFKEDLKKVTKLPIPNVIEVGLIIKELQFGEEFQKNMWTMPLSGNWQGYRDCHVKPDLVLIYTSESDILKLARIGSYSELFRADM